MEQKYLGITPYDEDSSFEFAGRSEETWALYDRIIRNDYTVYYAASGEGKSSLIRAGLLPVLRRRDFFPVYIVFEDKELEKLSAIENVINSRIEVESKKHEVTYEQSIWSKKRFDQEVSDQLKSNLWWRLRNYCFKRGDTELKPLFIFDQFEEVFTKANYDWTDHFFAWLEKISTDYLPDSLREIVNSRGIDMPTPKKFKALFSFRTEYLGDLDYWCVQKHFIPSLQDNRMCLKPLAPKGAKEIINLNESSLGKYADKIIQGCAESKTNTNNEEQPCVYALILSVVCQTLSEIPDNERIPLLDNLNNQQDDTIDDILLRFYKKKLLAVGLDYNKNVKIIADIENALVDEKGKRSRRDTDEASMQPLAKWIDLLSDKSNGLLKIIGKKEVDGHVVNTVEFPHDRLCKAIDSSRKERQGKISWKLNRQGEWMQFGIISTIMGIIAFLWNALMPSIKPVISNALSKTGFDKVIELFVSHYLKWEWKQSEYAGYSLDEGFSTLFLMVSLVLFIPLITLFINRRNKKWQILTALISLFSFFSFVFLWLKNRHISFANSYVAIFTFIGLSCCIASLSLSLLRLRIIYTKGKFRHSDKSQYSNWPLWGGYLIFASYVFYECLFRTTIGINEPCDSFWALTILPMLYVLWTWGFLNLKAEENNKKSIICVFWVSVLILISLSIISIIPYYNEFKRSHGFVCSLLLIILWITAFSYVIWHSKSNSHYYVLSKTKKILATIIGVLLLVSTFGLNLGYNPIYITPNTVCHVSSWRDVLVFEGDSVEKKFGFFYATDGDTIVPCYIPWSPQTDSSLIKGKCPFYCRVPLEVSHTNTPFLYDSVTVNSDRSMVWDSINRRITVYVPLTSTMEQYLHRIIINGVPTNNNLSDLINYYAACLFRELRKANINFAISGKSYNLDAIESLEKLDSLQHIALYKELDRFSLSAKDTTIISGGREKTRERIKVLEDKHLIDFHRELTRSFLLCLIKDRANQSDMPSLCTLSHTYLLAFFTSVPAMNFELNLTAEQYVAQESGSKNTRVVVNRKDTFNINSDDILNRRVFSWYNLFISLCLMDMSWNSTTFDNVYCQIPELQKNINSFCEISNELLPILEVGTTSVSDVLKSSRTAADSATVLMKHLENYIKSRNAKYYEPVLSRLKEIKLYSNTLVVDESFQEMKEKVLKTLLPLMNKEQRNIYNNDFENICKNLILVSAFRGNDIGNDTTDLTNYLIGKNDLFFITKKITSINGNINEINKKKIELEGKLTDFIESLKVKSKK